MLLKQNRLPRTAIPFIVKKGARYHSACCTVYVLPFSRIDTIQGTDGLRENQPSKFAFVVSKKTARHAVDRNRVRRRIRAAARCFLAAVHRGFGVVVVAKKEAKTAKFDEIAGELERLFQNAGLIATSEG